MPLPITRLRFAAILIVSGVVGIVCAAGATGLTPLLPRGGTVPGNDAPAGAFQSLVESLPTEAWRVAVHPTGFVPITNLPTEDVDVVGVTGAVVTPVPTAVWPTEGAVHFIDEGAMPPSVYASFATLSPNISGVDFVTNGTVGAFASLGYLYVYDMSVPANTFSVALPGTPARRDIDPILVDGGAGVIYATGTEIHRVSTATGTILWTTPLPSPVVEAVDPVVNAAGTMMFVPTEGWMTVINPVSGAVISSTFLGTTLVREVDARLAVGDTLCYLPASGSLFVFSGTTGGLLTTLPLVSPLIEGNDMEIDPTGTWGVLPTLSTMYQVDLAGMFFAATYPMPGAVHQRNQDAVFTQPSSGWQLALYPVQGMCFTFDLAAFVNYGPLATPGVLVDGVDAAVTDVAPSGTIAVLSTLGWTHVINMLTGSVTTLATPGVLRTDVDPKPGPLPGNRILQPTIGGLLYVDGFAPNEWVVTTSMGLHVVDVAAAMASEFIPMGALAYRGGDAQPTTLLGPAPASWQVDNPDQDFLTKCWEYKFAMNRWPYWWYYSRPLYYPHWIPFGVFGPPALLGYDHLNQVKLVVMPQKIGVLSAAGYLVQTIDLPTRVIGGLIWDWDNKICKARLYNQLEVVINLAPLAWGGLATFYFQPYGAYTRWYPVVDRMNGWEFVVYRGGRQVWIYDHLNGSVVTSVTLPARIIRRPVFDEQRKTLCLTLASRQLCFINAHYLRLGMPMASWLYYSPVFAWHVVGVPVFDIYNHYTLCKLRGGRIAVVRTDNGNLAWTSPVWPYWPVGPIRIDCYNKVAKCYYRNLGGYRELMLNLYPLAFSSAPLVSWIPVTGVPYGYPQFDSRDGYEFYRVGTTQIHYTYLFNAAVAGVVVTPYPIMGNLFIDRVNKYALCRLDGPWLFHMNLFKVTSGVPGATTMISLPAPAEEDIAFDVQGHIAAVHLQTGQVALIDMQEGTLLQVLTGLPLLKRQLYVHPFRHLFNYPWYETSTGTGGEVTIDVSPMRWDPPQPPHVNVATLPQPPVEAEDFTPPGAVTPALVHEVGHELGDMAGVVHFNLDPGAVEPGATIQVTNVTRMDGPDMDEPNEDVADMDGSAEVSVVADSGDVVCFTAFDAAGNASGETCVNVTSVGVPPGSLPGQFSFALAGANPVRSEAHFRFALPTRSRVELSLYDLAGRSVHTLLDRELEAGEHDAAWTLDGGGGQVAPGVYFARFQAGSYRAVERLVVIR